MAISFSNLNNYSAKFHEALKQVAYESEDRWSFCRITVKQQDNGFTHIIARCAFHVFQLIFEWFAFLFPSKWVSEKHREENLETLEYFYQVFGDARVERISDKYNLHFDRKYNNQAPITKKELQHLLAGVYAFTLEDIKELFDEIKHHTQGSLRFLSEDQIKKVKEEFKASCKAKDLKEVQFENLKTEQLDALAKLLRPFDYKTLCLNDDINPYPDFDKGYTIDGLLRLCGKIEELANIQIPKDGMDLETRKNLDLKAEVLLCKQIVGWHNPDNLMIRNPQGWLAATPRKHERKIDAAGMYAVYLKSIDRMQTDMLCFLPTQTLGFVPWKFEPLVEDFRPEIGARGIIHATKLLGFIRQQMDSFKEELAKKATLTDRAKHINYKGWELVKEASVYLAKKLSLTNENQNESSQSISNRVRNALIEWLHSFDDVTERLKAEGYRLRIRGYSLGGANAMRAAALMIASGIIEDIKTFAAPGIDKATKDFYENIKNLLPEELRPRYTKVMDHGDAVNFVGETSITPDELVVITSDRQRKAYKHKPLERDVAYADIFRLIVRGLESLADEHSNIIEEDSEIVRTCNRDIIELLIENEHIQDAENRSFEKARKSIGVPLFGEGEFIQFLKRTKFIDREAIKSLQRQAEERKKIAQKSTDSPSTYSLQETIYNTWQTVKQFFSSESQKLSQKDDLSQLSPELLEPPKKFVSQQVAG